jgi:hypothetical protein
MNQARRLLSAATGSKAEFTLDATSYVTLICVS